MQNQIPTSHIRRFVTTAIPYVNATPHIGFALEVVQADTLARFYRAAGVGVRLLAGTDENSIKNVQAADREGIPVSELVGRNATSFRALQQHLDLSYDDFIRTSVDPRHKPGAERLWRACVESGDIYKKAYRGLYCQGCEQFYKPGELTDGRCPEHETTLEVVEEENWFFRLSRYEGRLRKLYDQGKIEILPNTRRGEVLAWIEQGLEDFSISRCATRARGWGIPIPGDQDQVMYVWFDALANYITALGYATSDRLFSEYWEGDASREHVIGKGITRFHAIYWPAILLSAGLRLPTRILVHGYVTVDGRKISKSLGNTVDPAPLAAEFGADALRYYLLRHIRSSGDGDFSRDRLEQAYQSELADQLGNLAHRTLSMIERYCDGSIPEPPKEDWQSDSLIQSAGRLKRRVAAHILNFAFDQALDEIWVYVAEANRYVSEKQPWALAKSSASGDCNATASLRDCLFSLAVALQTIAVCISPLLPGTSRLLSKKLGCIIRSYQVGQYAELAGCIIEADTQLFPKERPVPPDQ